MGINKVILSGNLTRDCEIRESASGYFVIKFTIAVNRRAKVNDEWVDKADYIDCTLFANSQKRMAYFQDTLTKCAYVIATGSLSYSTWEKDGQKRSKLDVIAESVEVPKGKKKADDEPTYEVDDLPF